MEHLPNYYRQLVKHLDDLEKHLDKNEKWLQRPGIEMDEIEDNMTKWNRDFLNSIKGIEKLVVELQKKVN